MASEKKQFQFDRGIDMFLDGQYIGIVEADVSYDFGFVSGDGKWETGSGKGDPKFRPRIDITLSPRSVPVEDSRKASRAAWERIKDVFQVGVDPAKANETSKTVSKADERLEPGIGYRFLAKDELVVEGDELWWPPGRCWAPSNNHRLPSPRQAYDTTYRRRNQFAEGELVQIVKPATQALRDGEPKWRDAMDHLDGKVFEIPNVVWCDGWRSVPLFRRGSCTHFQPVHLDWLAPASSKQKAAFQAEKDKKAKVQELEDKMKAIESELAILKGT